MAVSPVTRGVPTPGEPHRWSAGSSGRSCDAQVPCRHRRSLPRIGDHDEDVRLTRLAPERKRTIGRREDEEDPTDNRVRLVIQAESRSDDGHLDFVERLFAHTSFEDPDILRETREEEGNTVEFNVHVVYIPGDQAPQGQAPQGVVIEEVGPAPGAEDGR